MYCRRLLPVAALIVSGLCIHGQQGAPPQTTQSQPTDFERRLVELEKKMRELDPGFAQTTTSTDISERLKKLEEKMEVILASRTGAATPVVASTPAPSVDTAASVSTGTPSTGTGPGSGLQAVSVVGDYQKAADTETRLPIAGYMDFHVNKNRGDSWRPDFHRFVLLFGHSFSDKVKFWSEFELEHSIVEGGEGSGEIALEQAYLDFLWKPALNFRAGMLLSPVGIINERHEPPSFNGVERPFVETVIIPTTWRELGAGLTGDLGRGFRYRAYVTSSLNARFFNAETGITDGKVNGFEASMRNPAKVGRLEYGGVRKLLLGTSYYTGHTGFDLPGINPRVSIYEFDGRYSKGQVDVRGLFARTWLTRTGELNRFLERRTGVNPNVGEQMLGWYFEPAYHVFRKRYRNDLTLFTRYEKYDTQHKMAAGFDPLGEFQRSSWIAGTTFKPVPDVAIKFDYVWNRNRSRVIRPISGINLGIGWWF
jgi:hypothetical protein